MVSPEVERRTAVIAGAAGVVIGGISLFQSCSANKIAKEANEIAKQSSSLENFKATAKFLISHNQGADVPSFSIVNESDIMLTEPPIIEYAVLSPSKIYFLFDGDKTPSNGDSVIFVYPYIPTEAFKEKQEPSTKGVIKTIEMPAGLKAKNDLTSTYNSKIITLENNHSLQINTLPFVIFACKITYKEHNSEESVSETLITTPLINAKVPDGVYEDILRYARDNSEFHYSNVNDKDNSYIGINDLISSSIEQDGLLAASELMGGTADGYNCILRYLADVINPNLPLMARNENNKVDIAENYAESCQEYISQLSDNLGL